MGKIDLDKPSSYLPDLPGIYQQDAFLGQFLKIFEKILSGIEDGVIIRGNQVKGIEQIIDRIYQFFDPELTPSEFLKWLAGWMALILRDDWEEVKKRRLMSRIMSLYRIRGTKVGLEEYLRIYVGAEGAKISIIEQLFPLQLGVNSTVGVDTLVGGSPPHYFIVKIEMERGEKLSEMLQVKRVAVADIVNLEKPAHTFYSLKILIPTLQIGIHSTIGNDTILGNWFV